MSVSVSVSTPVSAPIYLQTTTEVIHKNIHVVYVIKSNYKGTIRTYIGYSNNVARRLRQHNKIISGGAKHTRKANNWELLYYIRGFETHKEALSFEWYLAHRPPKYRCKMQISVKGRFKDTIRVMELWKQKHDKILWICPINVSIDDVEEFPCHLDVILDKSTVN